MGICEGGSFEPPLNTPRGNKVKLYHFLCPNEPVRTSGKGDDRKALGRRFKDFSPMNDGAVTLYTDGETWKVRTFG